MRLLRTLPALALLLGARASDYDTRDLLDVCAFVDADLAVPDLLGVVKAYGHIELCLCLSALPLFLETNLVTLAAVDVLGLGPVNAAVAALINDAAPGPKCNYPQHSKPLCIEKNPCGFQCTDGFTPSPANNPKECKCEKPNEVCNGVCRPKGACPSQKPQNTRRWLGSGSCSERGHGWVPCGVYGGSSRSWECVNTARDLESCGGCVVPLTAYSPQGKDCTAIPGVADVFCQFGQCAVRRCLPGLVPSADGSRCVLKHPKSMQGSDHEEVYESEYDEARIYGLEHVPLDRQ